ncbi:hypothetical protein AB3X34_07505 [Raoultella terrigena]|uniref:hypothetical protein n=1 Tax=Raoultella terrigena TaxID=577 RepID=UPI00349F19AF
MSENTKALNYDPADPDKMKLQAGNSPVIPDGYVMVPKEPTKEMLTASYMFARVDATRESWLAMLAAAQQAHHRRSWQTCCAAEVAATVWPVREMPGLLRPPAFLRAMPRSR